MRAGKLRSKIDILRFMEVELPNGATANEWAVYIRGLRCDDRVVSSRDLIRSGAEIDSETHTIEARYRGDILPTDRIRLSDGRELAIVGRPKPGSDQKKRSMIITAVYDGK